MGVSPHGTVNPSKAVATDFAVVRAHIWAQSILGSSPSTATSWLWDSGQVSSSQEPQGPHPWNVPGHLLP